MGVLDHDALHDIDLGSTPGPSTQLHLYESSIGTWTVRRIWNGDVLNEKLAEHAVELAGLDRAFKFVVLDSQQEETRTVYIGALAPRA